MATNDSVTDPFGSVDTSGFSDIDVQFLNCRFGQDAGYVDQEGNLLDVFLYDQLTEEGVTREDQILSMGKGLAIVDGGARVEWVNAKNAAKGGFPHGSKMQALLESCLATDEKKMLARYEETGLIPRDAGFWEGLSVHYVEVEKSYGKEGKTYREPSVTAVYGWDGIPDEDEPAPAKPAAKPAKASTKKAPAKPTPPKRPTPEPTTEAPVEGVTNTYGIDDTVFAELVALATAAADHYDFMEAAYKLDAIEDGDVQAVVDDEAGLFAAVKG